MLGVGAQQIDLLLFLSYEYEERILLWAWDIVGTIRKYIVNNFIDIINENQAKK